MTFPLPTRRTRVQAAAALAGGTLLLSACGSGGSSSSPTTAAGGSSSSTSASGAASSAPNGGTTPMQAGPVMVSDQWVKAVPDATAKMTGVFAKLKNSTDKPITIVSGKNSASPVTELHETVTVNGSPRMRPVANGFTIEPGQTRELKPGGDHIMVMNLAKPVKVGDELTLTLTTKDNQTIEFKAVARMFTGANETYVSRTN